MLRYTSEDELTARADNWGDAARAVDLLRRAVLESRPKPSIVKAYFEQLPALARQQLEMGDAVAAERYVEGAKLALADPQLAPYIDPAVRTALHDFARAPLRLPSPGEASSPKDADRESGAGFGRIPEGTPGSR